MTLNRAALLLAVTAPHLLLGGCGNEHDSSLPERDAVDLRIAILAPEDVRPIDVIMAEFESMAGVGASFDSWQDAGSMSRADIYFGESFIDLWEMAEADLLRPLAESLNERVVAGQLTEPERRFVPLAAAPRAVVFNPNLVSDDETRTIDNYASLADERWKGRLCLSSARIDGNRLLVAHLINRHDVREAEIIVRRWLRNLAATVYASDSALMAAISAGDCAVGILDLRLLGHAGSPADITFHAFTDQTSWLFDIAGAGISRHASHPEFAAEVVDWLLTAEGNAAYSIGWPETGLGRKQIDTRTDAGLHPALTHAASLAELGFLIEEADLLVQRAGYR